MFDMSKHLGKTFNITRYNCWHFARDVWFELTGDMLYDYTPASTTKYELELAAEDATLHFVEELYPNATTAPLLVLMMRAKQTPHIGVLYQGKVLHLRPEGVMYQPLDAASATFQKVKFYTTRAKQ